MSRYCSLFACCAFLVGFCPAPSVAQYPYEATTTSRVKVRSGPSENHYATGILERDSRVVVVGEKPNGWLAIEPPQGSFCWISGEFVKELSPTEGEVTGDNVLVRIGTPQDERLRDSWQKKLNQGDRVKILDKKSTGQGPLAKISYKIAPPHGEVRYVSSQYCQPTSAGRSDRGSGAATHSSERAAANKGVARPEHQSETEVDDEPEPSRTVHHREHPEAPALAEPRSPLDRANVAYEEMLQKKLPERDIARVRSLYEQAAQKAKTDQEHNWIAQRLENLQYQEERQAKFLEFDRLVRRSRQRDEALLAVPRKKEPTREPESKESGNSPAARFDGSGILRRSTVIIDGKPAYVLVGPQGGIRYYVTPAPGVDLQKFLDQLVAVRGPINYRVEVRAQHITVRDVTTIDMTARGPNARE